MKKISFIGVFSALAIIFGYIEYLVPLPLPFPGIKLGLANIVAIIALYLIDFKSSFLINITRGIISSILFGSLLSFAYSITGALLSIVVMGLCCYSKDMHVITVSLCGAISHIIGQIIVASIIVGFGPVMYYIPYLLLSSFVAGIIVGVIASGIVKRLERNITHLSI